MVVTSGLHLEPEVTQKVLLLLEQAGKILEESNCPRAWAGDDVIQCVKRTIEDHLT